eukprot:scaffold2421_cov171-Ochromonas_danica.AAC.7
MTYFTGMILLYWMVYLHYNAISQKHQGKTPKNSLRQLRNILKVIYFTSNLAMVYHLIARVASGQCRETAWLNTWLCNPTADAHLLPLDVTTILMLMPLVYGVVVKGPDFYMIFGIWILNMTTFIVAMIYGDLGDSFGFVGIYFTASVVIHLETFRLNYFHFFTHLKLLEVWREKEKAADAANALEMRHMIANVAHDLKTPLSSFYGGVEYITHLLGDLSNNCVKNIDDMEVKAKTICFEAFGEFVQSMQACLSNMRNTNSFMMMTINRCIDYTKTSKGMKLSPKLETVDLLESLSLPLLCMQDVQQRIQIILEPCKPDEICSHIITDKQWLQENLLCLLSNAVKYSNEGEVRIRIEKKKVESSVRDEGYTDPQFSLRIEVEDQGIGLSEEEMSTLFSPFRQAQRLAGGTGLGLFALAKRLEALEGHYGVQKRRDHLQGSLFWFEIPYRPDTQASSFFRPLNTASSVTIDPLFSDNIEKVSRVMSACNTISSRSTACPGQSTTWNNSNNDVGMLCTSDEEIPGSVVRSETVEKESAEKENQCVVESPNEKKTAPEPKLPIVPTGSCGPPSSPWHVLVVDDSPAILKMTTLMLRRHHHNVATAINGAEAVKMVADRVREGNRGYDVILMDMQMPVMDGLEATRRLRALENCRQASNLSDFDDIEAWRQIDPNFRQVIIGLSANSDAVTIEDAFQAGIDEFLKKPFSLDAFYLAWQKIDQERRLRRE